MKSLKLKGWPTVDFCLNQKSTFSPWLHVIWTTFAFRAPIHRSVSSRLRTRSSHIWLPRVYQHVFSIIFTNVWVLRTVPHLQTLIFFRWAFSLWCIAANRVQSIALLCIPHWCSCCFSKLGPADRFPLTTLWGNDLSMRSFDCPRGQENHMTQL